MISTDWYIGEIRAFPYDVCPPGWWACEGQRVPFVFSPALLNLIGFTFGGSTDQKYFVLPDLRGKAIVGLNNNALNVVNLEYSKSAGEAQHTLTTDEVPSHNHTPQANNQAGGITSVNGTIWGVSDEEARVYGEQGTLVVMNSAALDSAGGSQAHNNMQPYLPLHYCIAYMGAYPSPHIFD